MAAPTDPLRLRVLEAIQTKLRLILGNPTYHYTAKSTSVVIDPSVNILTLPTTETPYFIVEPTPEGSKFYMPAMRMREQFQCVITARVDAAQGAAAKTQAWERLIADIETAITQDITLGSLVVDTRLLTPTPGFDLGVTSTIIVVYPLVCTMIRTYGSP